MNEDDALTYASHGPSSVARKGDRLLRGPEPPTQPVNWHLHAMREDWDLLTVSERVEAVRGSLLFIGDPVSHLDEHDHVTPSRTTPWGSCITVDWSCSASSRI